MVEKAEVKAEALLNLDDLLQCPVCYEIPSGQIFQCNEGHHVCGRCKVRLDVCPVCRALFFGTRNYAMEELISNFKKLKTLKSGSTATAGSSESSTPPKDRSTEDAENVSNEEEENEVAPPNVRVLRAPPACKGLFRCLCCKNGNNERLPAARLLNHLRYYHRPDLLEGRTENGEYLQAWQIATTPGRVVTAVRIADMGIFFLVIEISSDSVCSWLSMATSPWIAHTFNYTITICGNDREAIFSDRVWSVRSCEGTLKKRGHCLMVTNLDAQALVAPTTISTKLCIRRTPEDQISNQTTAQPRAVLRIANRVNNERVTNFEPFLQEFTNDVTRLFANLDREANALVLLEREIRSRNDNDATQPAQVQERQPAQNVGVTQPLSRNARRRMRLRLRMALNELADVSPVRSPPAALARPMLATPPRRHLVTRPPPQMAARPSLATAAHPTTASAARPTPACTVCGLQPACTARHTSACAARPNPPGVARPISATAPRPISATVPRPISGTAPRLISRTTPRPISGTAPRPISGTAPRPISGTTPRPISGTSPRPISGTIRRPISITAPRPISATTPRVMPATASPPTSATTARPISITAPRPISVTTPRVMPATASPPTSATTARPTSAGTAHSNPATTQTTSNRENQRVHVASQTYNNYNGFQQEDNRMPARQVAHDNSPPPVAPPSASGPSNARPQNGNRSQKKRRNRR